MEPAKPDLTLSSEVFKYWKFDYRRRRVSIAFQDGRTLEGEFDFDGFTYVPQIDESIFDWERWWVLNTTSRGHLLIAEAYSPTDSDPIRGRPTVYLDQNHWSTVAQAFAAPERIRDISRRRAATRLAELANDGKVILPLSSAHLRETARLDRERRYEVAVTMGSLAGGWQVRHPNRVWRNEVTALLAAETGAPLPALVEQRVVTLEPHVQLDDGVEVGELAANSSELFFHVLNASSITLEVLLDPKRAERQSINEWVARNEENAAALAATGLNTARRRDLALKIFWRDNAAVIQDSLSRLGLGLSSIAHLDTSDIPRLLSAGPMLGYFSDLMTTRLLDSQRRWKENDLTDLIFLSTGAAYCDIVVAERSTGRQLQQLQRQRATQLTVFTDLESAVGPIEDLVRGRAD
jgi:hypothetical protein